MMLWKVLHSIFNMHSICNMPAPGRVGSLSLLQGIFPTQESNWGLLHCRQILYQLSYKGSFAGENGAIIFTNNIYMMVICNPSLYVSVMVMLTVFIT